MKRFLSWVVVCGVGCSGGSVGVEGVGEGGEEERVREEVVGGEEGDPLEGSLFTREELFELVRADRAGGDRRAEVFARYQLIDVRGEENVPRLEAYERTLARYAERDPEGWSVFVVELEGE